MMIQRVTSRWAFLLAGVLTCIVISFEGCSPKAASPPPPAVPATSHVTPPAVAPVGDAAWRPWHAEELLTDGFTAEEGFRSLSFSDFESFFAKPPKEEVTPTWQQVGYAIVCTGKPKGYLFSKEKFEDFTLRLEFRFAPSTAEDDAKEFTPNTGILVYITEPHKQWPKSLEVQGKFSELATIKPNGGAANVELEDDAAARESARKPISEWNALEVVSKAGALTARLNGATVCESRPSDVSSGSIGLQSEDFEVHFRRLRIRTE